MSFGGDPLALYGKRIVEEHHATLLRQLPPFKLDPRISDPFDISNDLLRSSRQLKVGIIGAGIGGLYTALILDSLGIKYEILEASDRTGGRLSTYKFPKGGKYDYYEAGAMRFPLPKKDAHGNYKDGIMKRLAELIEYKPLNQGQDRLNDKLIPYYYTVRKGSKPGFYYFNRVSEPVSTAPKGSFNADAMDVHADYIRAGADAINSDVLSPFRRMVIEDFKTGGTRGWDVLKENNSYSLRAYMASKYMPSDNLKLPPRHLPDNVINWCEFLGGSTGGYDRALAEEVFYSLEFANINGADYYGEVDWKCFEGGTETLSKKMEEYVKKKGGSIKFRKRVTGISEGQMVVCVLLPRKFPRGRLPFDVEPTFSTKSVDHVIKEVQVTSRMPFLENKLPVGVEQIHSEFVDLMMQGDEVRNDPLLGNKLHPSVEEISREQGQIRADHRESYRATPCVAVTVNGTETERYSHVISTLPLPVLRTVDLKGAGLNVMQRNSLRALTYGPAVKIAILFKSNWWTTKLGIVGGQSFTDLPIHTIVYPSYGVDSSTPCKVLIASYTWTADADRLAALAAGNQQEALKELVLHNLAEAHNHLSSDITYEYLQGEFVDMHVKDWSRDPYTMGAYAYFTPGEFEDLYAALNAPAAGKRLHFAGEAISTRHGWVVGALDSAWKAVYEYLKVTGQVKEIERFKQIWGENVEWTGRSTLVDGPDLLDQHLGLVDKAVLVGAIGAQAQKH